MGNAVPRGVKPLPFHTLVFATLTLAFCAAGLQAATLERLSLDDMITKSTVIVRAKVSSSCAAYSGPMIYTHYQIQVSETLKGPARSSMEIQVPGGVANNMRQTFAGAPQFNPGDEFVFFLWTGTSGSTQILGLTQGLFALAADGSADPVTTRNASHEMMLERGTARQVKDQTLVMHLSDLRSRIGATLAANGVAK
jgi:hypothetical protein